MEELIKRLEKDYLTKIANLNNLQDADQLFLELFGKNGQITTLPKEFSKLPKDQLKQIGPLFNQVKQILEQATLKKRQVIREEGYKKLKDEKFEIKDTKIKKRLGHYHPVIEFEEEIAELFSKIGFQRFDTPHIDNDYYNFESLNIPPNHPARDLWDTLYLQTQNKEDSDKVLLRTHTSNFQNRVIREYKPPIRLINLGRCFRYENLDARHEHTFDQFDLIYIDKNVSMTNLQYLSEYFLKSVFGQEIKVRMRPKYYPFVEPGVGIDGECIFCKGKGCKICGGGGWLELAGAGMIHPFVLKEAGINPDDYSGLAWGFGPFRMAMIKFVVNDIRTFNSGNLKELYK